MFCWKVLSVSINVSQETRSLWYSLFQAKESLTGSTAISLNLLQFSPFEYRLRVEEECLYICLPKLRNKYSWRERKYFLLEEEKRSGPWDVLQPPVPRTGESGPADLAMDRCPLDQPTNTNSNTSQSNSSYLFLCELHKIFPEMILLEAVLTRARLASEDRSSSLIRSLKWIIPLK